MASNDFTSVILEEVELFISGQLAKQTSILDRFSLQRSNLRRDINPGNEIAKINEDGQGVTYKYELPEYYIYVDLGVRGVDSTPQGAGSSPFAYKNLGVGRAMVDDIQDWITRSGKVSIYSKDPAKSKALKRATLKLDKQTKQLSRAKLQRNAAFAVAKGVKKHGIKATKFVLDSMTPQAFQRLADRIAERTGKQAMITIVDSLK